MSTSLFVSGDSKYTYGLQPCVSMHPGPKAKDLWLPDVLRCVRGYVAKTPQIVSSPQVKPYKDKNSETLCKDRELFAEYLLLVVG